MCNAAAQERCRLTAVGTANVVAVRDGRTLMLDDGRELQLAAIEVADDSRNALQSLVGGGPAPTRTAGRRERPLWSAGRAFAFAGEAQQSLQAAMLE